MTLLSQLRIWESLYRSVESGLVDPDMLRAALDGPGPFELEYFIESWPEYRVGFAPDFVVYFEARVGL